MTIRIVFAAALLSVALCIGCGESGRPREPQLPKAFLELRAKSRHVPEEVRAVLDAPDRFTLFSIEGEDQPPDISTEKLFHGFDILGKIDIETPDEQKALVQALYTSIAKSEQTAICFWPRHGIRAAKDDQMVDLLICFECMHIQIVVSQGNRHMTYDVWTTREPAAAFDAPLKRAGVRLAKPPVN